MDEALINVGLLEALLGRPVEELRTVRLCAMCEHDLAETYHILKGPLCKACSYQVMLIESMAKRLGVNLPNYL